MCFVNFLFLRSELVSFLHLCVFAFRVLSSDWIELFSLIFVSVLTSSLKLTEKIVILCFVSVFTFFPRVHKSGWNPSLFVCCCFLFTQTHKLGYFPSLFCFFLCFCCCFEMLYNPVVISLFYLFLYLYPWTHKSSYSFFVYFYSFLWSPARKSNYPSSSFISFFYLFPRVHKSSWRRLSSLCFISF